MINEVAQVPKEKVTLLAIEVSNTTGSLQKVRVLFPNAAREKNFDNPHGIIIENMCHIGSEEYTPNYESILNYLKGKKVTIGATQVIATTNCQFASTLVVTVHTEDIKKNRYYGVRIPFTTNPYQNQIGNVINNTEFELNNEDGESGLIFNMAVNAKASFYFYIKPEGVVREHLHEPASATFTADNTRIL